MYYDGDLIDYQIQLVILPMLLLSTAVAWLNVMINYGLSN